MDKIDVTPKTMEEFVTMVEMHNLYHTHEVMPGKNRYPVCRVCHMPIEDGKKGKETISRKGNTSVYEEACSLEGFGTHAGEYNPVWLLAWYLKAREFNMVEGLFRHKGDTFKSVRYVDEVKAAVLRWFNPVLAMKEGFKSQAYARAAYIYAMYIGKSDEMRAGASMDPEWALEYAMKADKGTPHQVTRDGACRYMETAMDYASKVDKGYHPSTMIKAMETPTFSFQYLTAHHVPGQTAELDGTIKGRWVRDAETALKYATVVGPEDDTRALVHMEKNPEKLLAYARDIDKAPRDDSRAIMIEIGDGSFIYKYAQQVDKAGRDDTRAAALSDAQAAFAYAKYIDKGPRDDTRTAACKQASIALQYAKEIDGVPCDETRNAACSMISTYGLEYALAVDGKPHHVTRTCACQTPDIALRYTKEVDYGEHPMTRFAVCALASTAYTYAAYVRQPDDMTRRAACMDPGWATEYAVDVDKCPRNDTREAASYAHEREKEYHRFEMEFYGQGLASLDLFATLNLEEIKRQHGLKIYVTDVKKWEVAK
jgi:hypothetical protein